MTSVMRPVSPRVEEMLSLLSEEWVTLGALADRMRITPVTAYAYMKELRHAEPRIESAPIPRGTFGTDVERSVNDEARLRRYRLRVAP